MLISEDYEEERQQEIYRHPDNGGEGEASVRSGCLLREAAGRLPVCDDTTGPALLFRGSEGSLYGNFISILSLRHLSSNSAFS